MKYIQTNGCRGQNFHLVKTLVTSPDI